MARIRSIKPEFWDSELLGRCSTLARLTFVGLISLADDQGRGRGETRWLRGQLHGYDKKLTDSSFGRVLVELTAPDDEGVPMVVFYQSGASSYYWIPKYLKHQKIDHPSKSKLPPPPDLLANPREGIRSPRESHAEDQGSGIKDQGSGRGVDQGDDATPPPLVASRGDADGGQEEGDEGQPPLPAPQGEPAAIGPEQAPEPPKTEIALTLEAFGGFLTPSYTAKLSTVLDLQRQGVSHERMRRAAVEHGDWDFYAVVKTLRNGGGKGDRGGPPPPRKDPTPSPSRAEGQKLLDDARAAVDAKLAELPADQIAEWTRQAEQEAAKLPESMRKLCVTSALRRRAGVEFGIKGV